MGQFIHHGICIRIGMQKKDIPINDLENCLRQEVNLDLYHKKEEENYFFWEIDKKIFRENIIQTLEFQKLLLVSRNQKEMDLIIEDIKNLNYDEIINLAEQKRHEYFQESQINHYVQSHGKTINCFYNIISICNVGKAYLEGYNDYFHHLENLIRQREKEFPLLGAMKVGLDM